MNNYQRESGGPPPDSPRQLADQLFGVVRRLRGHATELAADFDLSFLQVRALWRLERQPLPTGALAEQLGLDSSNVTSVVDGLEARGLVARQAHVEDRRVKLLVLTDEGRAVRARIDERLFATLTIFDVLTGAERHQLVTLLAKLSPAASEPSPDPVAP
ncbi:MAG TPA: MarR family transcriptional regulator [Acidimicrobiia bacterium]|nr:MarR family transcriptional regulator [Acidimicrobiia bacterium]